MIRREPDKARELILHLSQFFRSNLKQNVETVTLREELAHVNAYLTIEKRALVTGSMWKLRLMMPC